jgi:hypothetical protein
MKPITAILVFICGLSAIIGGGALIEQGHSVIGTIIACAGVACGTVLSIAEDKR